MIETNIRYLPNAYRCAIERADADSDLRPAAKLTELCDLYASASGLPHDEQHRDYVASALAIAARRFPVWRCMECGLSEAERARCSRC